VGSAFAKRNYQSNALIEAWSQGPEQQGLPDENLLIDFGATGPLALYQLKSQPGFEYLDHSGSNHYRAIQRVFITHLHHDHIGGLEELAIVNRLSQTNVHAGSIARPMLFGAGEILSDLWECSLRGGLGVFDGRRAALDDYFSVQPLDPKGTKAEDRIRLLDRYEFIPIRADHIRISKKFDWPSYGLVIRDSQTGQTALYSGDTRFEPETLEPVRAQARLIFHEAQLDDEPQPVHTLLSELRTLPESTRKKTFLYHFADSWDDPKHLRIAEEFAGFARSGKRYAILP